MQSNAKNAGTLLRAKQPTILNFAPVARVQLTAVMITSVDAVISNIGRNYPKQKKLRIPDYPLNRIDRKYRGDCFMTASYKTILKLLIGKDMKEKCLCAKERINPTSVTKIGRNVMSLRKFF